MKLEQSTMQMTEIFEDLLDYNKFYGVGVAQLMEDKIKRQIITCLIQQ